MLSDLKNILKRCLKRSEKEPSPEPLKKPELPKTLAHSRDKHGVRTISPHANLDRLLNESVSPSPDQDEVDAKAKVAPEKQGYRIGQRNPNLHRGDKSAFYDKPLRVNKNGLPFISNELNLLRAFTPVSGEEELDPSSDLKKSLKPGPAEEKFEAMLSRSLSGKSTTRLLQEKDTLYQHGKATPLSEKIRRYPAPESELDLHGCTALQATEKADRFIQNGFHSGKLTLRIIVGKGLHSEEGAVLPDVVEEKVIALKKENIVLSYRWENRIKSKSGAMVVYLA